MRQVVGCLIMLIGVALAVATRVPALSLWLLGYGRIPRRYHYYYYGESPNPERRELYFGVGILLACLGLLVMAIKLPRRDRS